MCRRSQIGSSGGTPSGGPDPAATAAATGTGSGRRCRRHYGFGIGGVDDLGHGLDQPLGLEHLGGEVVLDGGVYRPARGPLVDHVGPGQEVTHALVAAGEAGRRVGHQGEAGEDVDDPGDGPDQGPSDPGPLTVAALEAEVGGQVPRGPALAAREQDEEEQDRNREGAEGDGEVRCPGARWWCPG